MTRDFRLDSNCSACGSLLFGRTIDQGVPMMNADFPSTLKYDATKQKYYFECENCHAKNEVQKIDMGEGKPLRLILTGAYWTV